MRVRRDAWASQSIPVPSAIGERAQVLRIRRLGDPIEVARSDGPA
jgi:hypothetical protein